MNYIERMKVESQELEKRILNLEHFINDKDRFLELSAHQRGLMSLQLTIMEQYSATLDSRIFLEEEVVIEEEAKQSDANEPECPFESQYESS